MRLGLLLEHLNLSFAVNVAEVVYMLGAGDGGGGGGGEQGGGGGRAPQGKQERRRLAPSRSTVYVGNLDYGLTNNDVFRVFEALSPGVKKVSIVKDRQTRESSGIAFVLYADRTAALAASQAANGKRLNGRTLKASLANDNGRAKEFIRRKVYEDKSRCYECGAEGHLSYECPNNQLGPRERPVKKRSRGAQRAASHNKDGANNNTAAAGSSDEEGDNDARFEEDDWASAVAPRPVVAPDRSAAHKPHSLKGPKLQRGYFSDESGED
eukprot:jgi/Chlat1/9012/Chrsp94S08293